MEIKEQIEKIHRETCVQDLKDVSTLTGKESDKQLNDIFEICQCIQASILFNGFSQ